MHLLQIHLKVKNNNTRPNFDDGQRRQLPPRIGDVIDGAILRIESKGDSEGEKNKKIESSRTWTSSDLAWSRKRFLKSGGQGPIDLRVRVRFFVMVTQVVKMDLKVKTEDRVRCNDR